MQAGADRHPLGWPTLHRRCDGPRRLQHLPVHSGSAGGAKPSNRRDKRPSQVVFPSERESHRAQIQTPPARQTPARIAPPTPIAGACPRKSTSASANAHVPTPVRTQTHAHAPLPTPRRTQCRCCASGAGPYRSPPRPPPDAETHDSAAEPATIQTGDKLRARSARGKQKLRPLSNARDTRSGKRLLPRGGSAVSRSAVGSKRLYAAVGDSLPGRRALRTGYRNAAGAATDYFVLPFSFQRASHVIVLFWGVYPSQAGSSVKAFDRRYPSFFASQTKQGGAYPVSLRGCEQSGGSRPC